MNNAGVGTFGALINNELKQIEQLIQVNIEATTILSILYARDYANKPGAQLINVSSAMGYVIGLGNVAYSASKFYVSVLTEVLAAELKNATLKAKVLAPAYTDTAFIQQSSEKKSVATNIQLRSPQEVATYLLALYESEHILGIVDEKNQFTLSDARFPVFSL
ncbi:SDR family NAD(P)-dependent oxidoreductase [Enterococcus termitis]